MFQKCYPAKLSKMSILVSPSNNSGWGLGVKGMYGSGRRWSEAQPVRVRKYYRAKWGTVNGRRSRTRTSVDEVIDGVVAQARRRGPRIRHTRRLDIVVRRPVRRRRYRTSAQRIAAHNALLAAIRASGRNVTAPSA